MDAEQTSDQDAAALRRPALSSTAVRILTINAIFGALIGLGLYAATEPSTLLLRWAGISGAGRWSGAGEGGGQAEEKQPSTAKQVQLVGAASLSADDPVIHFAQTRVGHLVFAPTGRDNCQRLLFDNRNGNYYDAAAIFCGHAPEQIVEADTPARLMAIRKSLQR
jgi:hypothetical protein